MRYLKFTALAALVAGAIKLAIFLMPGDPGLALADSTMAAIVASAAVLLVASCG